ncbi:MAG: transcription termination factor NusA [bacterium]
MANTSDFIPVIYQIGEERGLDRDVVIEIAKNAIVTAYKKDNPESAESLKIEIDSSNNSFTVLADKKVVEEITDPSTQISLEQAKKFNKRLKEGDHLEIDVTPESFGRIASQAAKQRIMQDIQNAERDAMISKFSDKVGTIVTGIVQKFSGGDLMVEIDKAFAVFPPSEQVRAESYRPAARMRFLLKQINSKLGQKAVVVSRSDPDFLIQLFHLEVPEIESGTVVVKAIAREVGVRSKVAVYTSHDKVDPQGACIGPKGARINVISDEINPEKVDVILWNPDLATFIKNALSPAKVEKVDLDVENNKATVWVQKESLSLAIGKEGQNARLANKLTGVDIDIRAVEAVASPLGEEIVEE